jgi:hypothetical protein
MVGTTVAGRVTGVAPGTRQLFGVL